MRVKRLLSNFSWGILVGWVLLIAGLLAWGGSRHFSPWEAPSAFVYARRAHYAYFLPALYLHVLSSPVVLVLGILGLWPWWRQTSQRWHRRLGKVYVGLILGVAAPSGLVMAFFAGGGWLGVSCFLLLSLLWAWTTWKAWRLAVEGDWAGHRLFMWRSFALASSAFFLRLLSFLGVYFLQWQGPMVYVGWAWCSWLLPLGLVEMGQLWSKQGD